jgi:hypothetical protein
MVLLAVQTHHGAVLEVPQVERTQLHVALAAQKRRDPLVLIGGKECNGSLVRQLDQARAVIGRQPEFHLRALRRVAPVPGKHEPLLLIQRLLASSAQFSARRTRGRRHAGLQYKTRVASASLSRAVSAMTAMVTTIGLLG